MLMTQGERIDGWCAPDTSLTMSSASLLWASDGPLAAQQVVLVPSPQLGAPAP